MKFMPFRVAIIHIEIKCKVISQDNICSSREIDILGRAKILPERAEAKTTFPLAIKLARRDKRKRVFGSRVRGEDSISTARRSPWLAYFRARYSECRSNNGTLLFGPVAAASQSGAG